MRHTVIIQDLYSVRGRVLRHGTSEHAGRENAATAGMFPLKYTS